MKGAAMKTEKRFNLWLYVRRNWKQYLILAIALVIWQIGQIVANIYNGNALTALTNRRLSGFFINEAISALAWGIFLLFYFITSKYGAIVMKTVDNLIRGDLSQTVADQEYEEFNRNNESDYLSWFTNDINQLNQSGYQALSSAFGSTVLAILSSTVLLFYHPLLLVSTLVLAVIMVSFPKIFQKKLGELSVAQSEKNQQLTTKLTDVLEGFTNLLMLGQRNLIKKTVLKASENAGQAMVAYQSESNFSGALINLVSIASQIILTVETGYLAFQRQLPIGAILIVGSMAGQVFSGLTNISFQLTAIRAVQPIFDKYNKIVKSDDEPGQPVGPLTNEIAINNLSFSYDRSKHPILSDFTQAIKQGEHIAIIGASGSGKSTLVKLLAGLLNDYEGSLTWDGTEYRTIDKSSLHQQLSYIDQSSYIFDGSLRFNITLGRSVQQTDLNKAIEQAGLENFIADSPQGLDTPLKHAGNNISGGQKQRIALARNLLTSPKVVLADEITSAIDEQDGQKIEQSLLDLQGVTLIYISHHLRPEIQQQFDRIIKFDF